ncbi:MAG: creatininase family protein [Alphaproteobacteria bacterium]
MRLDHATWQEVEAYLGRSHGIIIPTGSTEQHGPMGLIGTDALCAQAVAEGAAQIADAYVAPTLAYTPAPFNMAFPGTISISQPVFEALVSEILEALISHGFDCFYFLNGHGANLAPLAHVTNKFEQVKIRIANWWDFPTVDALRREYYDDWEGMHATPSEIAMTQAIHRTVAPGAATAPPQKLSPEYIRGHAGDRHGPPDHHRRQFPDGRVGSHSALATPEHGSALLKAAASAVASDYADLFGVD